MVQVPEPKAHRVVLWPAVTRASPIATLVALVSVLQGNLTQENQRRGRSRRLRLEETGGSEPHPSPPTFSHRKLPRHPHTTAFLPST